jgi:hypothetical protein
MTHSAPVVVFSGTRTWTNSTVAHQCVDKVLAKYPDVTIRHGAAKGLDTIVHHYATERGAYADPFPADWLAHGKSAGVQRNIAMLDAGCIGVVAFLQPGSKGTHHMVGEAIKRGIPVWLIWNPAGDVIKFYHR